MISIVIPTYNSSRFMPNLLDSIFKNKIDDMEVVIVDDLSTDDTVEIANRYPVKVIKHWATLKIMFPHHNRT